MDSVFKSLFFREPLIHYVSPPICENLFSSSSGPVIVLNAFEHLGPVTGFIMGGAGDFFLRWGHYPAALCYSVYQSTDPSDPFGTYVLIAECIPNPEFDFTGFPDGYYRITAITPEGETPLSEPFDVVKIPAQCPHFDPPFPSDISANPGDNISIEFFVNEGAGFGQVQYVWFKDGFPILDTTNTSKGVLALPSVTEGDEGVYTLRLTNNSPTCDVFSADVNLSVGGCPLIVDPQPDLGVNVIVGATATLGPFVVNEEDCGGSVVYEWYKDGVLYSDTTGTTQGSLVINNAQESDSGGYALHLSCDTLGCDVAISNTIALDVGTCADTVADIVWVPDINNSCASASISAEGSPPPDGAGVFSLTNEAGCYRSGPGNWVILTGVFCNNTASDINLTVNLQVTSKSGSYSSWNAMQLQVGVDGSALPPYFDYQTFVSEPALDDQLTAIVTVTPGEHTIVIRVNLSVQGNPSFTIGGSLFTLGGF